MDRGLHEKKTRNGGPAPRRSAAPPGLRSFAHVSPNLLRDTVAHPCRRRSHTAMCGMAFEIPACMDNWERLWRAQATKYLAI
jgi:hypothetical protein